MRYETSEKKFSDHGLDTRIRNSGGISVIVLLAILILRLIVFSKEIIISLKAYNIAKGLSASPWVGLAYYKEVLSSYYLGRILLNTITFNFLFSIFVFVIAFSIARIILTLPKGSIFKDTMILLFLLPLFLSSEVYTHWLINALGSNLFVNPSVMRFLHPLLSSVKYAGIPVLLAYILDEIHEEKDPFLSIKVAGLFSLVSLAFIANSCYSLTKAMYNPLVYSTLDTLDTFMYRTGLLEADYGINSALGVMQTAISLLSFALLFVPIRLLFSVTFKKIKTKLDTENVYKKLTSAAIALIIFTVIYFLPYFVNGQPFDFNRIKSVIGSPMLNYLTWSLISGLISGVLASIISWSFVNPNKKLVFFSAFTLLLITVLAAKPLNFSEYSIIKSLGLTNTGFAIIASTCFSAGAAWAMVCVLKSEVRIFSRDFFLAAAGVFLIQAALIYCNTTPPSIYLSTPYSSPLVIFKSMTSGMLNTGASAGNAPLIKNPSGLYGFIISLPSIVLFLTAKILLQKRQLISIISGGIKN